MATHKLDEESIATTTAHDALNRELAWFLAAAAEPTPSPQVEDLRIGAILASGLSGLPAPAIQEGVERALALIGRYLNVERAFYYRVERATDEFILTHEWHAEALRSLKSAPEYARLPVAVLPRRLIERLQQGGVLRLPRTRGLLDGMIEERVSEAGDRSLALVPVTVGGALLGIAGFAAACGSTWESRYFELLQVVAQGIGRIVERQCVEDELRGSEARFRAICEAAPLGIFLANENGECVYLNPAGQRITGLDGAAAEGRGWMSALHEEDRASIAAGWGKSVAGSAHYRAPVHRFVRPDGEVRSVEVRAVPVSGAGNSCFLGLLEDVTERLRREQERAELLLQAEMARAEAEATRAELANILCRISDGFAAFDLEDRYTYVNDVALAILGRSKDTLIGRQVWTEFPERVGSPFHLAFQRAVAEQTATRVEEFSAATGRWYDLRLYPSPSGVSVFFEDVTGRKRAEDQLMSDREYLRQELSGLDHSHEVVGLSLALRQVMERVKRVAATQTTVLVSGETGTGKELVARAIHEASPRRERLLVKVNCAAISAGLVESELFGHERGAFTGAISRRKGRFELAHGGTLFLDEVGELPLETQAKLLRVLQEREFERVGGSETIRVDVRVVAATNRNLAEMVEAGRFREDLFYRLNVFPVTLPSLRERPQDIPLLAHAFVRRFGRQAGRPVERVSLEAMQRLQSYSWPGNVRELENVIERAVILAPGDTIGLDALPELTHAVRWPSTRPPAHWGMLAASGVPTGATVAELERAYVEQILGETRWVIEGERGAARRLGVHPNTLRSRLKRWGIKRPTNDVIPERRAG